LILKAAGCSPQTGARYIRKVAILSANALDYL
jgi:hypothetical protein